MQMNELVQILMVLFTGVLLGAIFFGGLWWTVQRGLSARQPALWFGASMLLRTAVVLAGRLLFCCGSGREAFAGMHGRIHHRALCRDQTDHEAEIDRGKPCALAPTN